MEEEVEKESERMEQAAILMAKAAFQSMKAVAMEHLPDDDPAIHATAARIATRLLMFITRHNTIHVIGLSQDSFDEFDAFVSQGVDDLLSRAGLEG